MIVEAAGKVHKQIPGREAERSDLIECATIDDLMSGKSQDLPENIALTRQKDVSYSLVRRYTKNMDQIIEYNRNFSLPTAYQFLQDNGLGDKAIEIRNSSDKFKSYTSTLRRAKIIVLVKKNNLFDRFANEVWPSGNTRKGISRTRFFENLCHRFLGDQEGITQDDDESEEESPVEETQFAYEDDLRNYLANNLHIIEDGLKLYVSDTGEKGIEYPIPETQRRIDILYSIA